MRVRELRAETTKKESGSNEARDMVRAQGMEDPAGPGEDGRWRPLKSFEQENK